MGKLYNRQIQNEKRRELRRNMTKAEAILWRELKDKKLHGCKFRRQHGIGAYIVDFYCPSLKLAIEIDGATHNTDEEIEFDFRRQKKIEEIGISFLRFTNPEIYTDLHNVLEKIIIRITELRGGYQRADHP